jgi:hypothetical protein
MANEIQQEEVVQEKFKIPEVLTDDQALIVLVNAARIAQSKGIYTLEEAELISKSIRHFTILSESGPVPTA